MYNVIVKEDIERKLQSMKTAAVGTLDFYYVFTAIDGINLPHFAPFRISVTE